MNLTTFFRHRKYQSSMKLLYLLPSSTISIMCLIWLLLDITFGSINPKQSIYWIKPSQTANLYCLKICHPLRNVLRKRKTTGIPGCSLESRASCHFTKSWWMDQKWKGRKFGTMFLKWKTISDARKTWKFTFL